MCFPSSHICAPLTPAWLNTIFFCYFINSTARTLRIIILSHAHCGSSLLRTALLRFPACRCARSVFHNLWDGQTCHALLHARMHTFSFLSLLALASLTSFGLYTLQVLLFLYLLPFFSLLFASTPSHGSFLPFSFSFWVGSLLFLLFLSLSCTRSWDSLSSIWVPPPTSIYITSSFSFSLSLSFSLNFLYQTYSLSALFLTLPLACHQTCLHNISFLCLLHTHTHSSWVLTACHLFLLYIYLNAFCCCGM